MTQVSYTLPNVLAGVSQQQKELRRPSHLEAQDNCFSSPLLGLTRRPPFTHLAKLPTDPQAFTNSLIENVRDTGDVDYTIVALPGDLKVYNPDTGAEYPVAFPDGKSYLHPSAPDTNMRIVSLFDTVFVLNKAYTVLAETPAAPSTDIDSLLFVRATNYKEKLTVEITAGSATVHKFTIELPAADNSNQAIADATRDKINTDAVAKVVVDYLSTLSTVAGYVYTNTQGASLNSLGFTVEAQGAVIRLRKTGQYTIKAYDGYSGDHFTAIKGVVSRLSVLPEKAYPGFTIRVDPNPETPFGSYWVQYKEADAATGSTSGLWVEVPGPGSTTTLNASTMPYVLVPDNSGGFIFKKAPWASRTTGDDPSTPPPSFIGERIRDMAYIQGRLALLTADRVTLSASGNKQYTFWKTRGAQTIDTDPIDLGSTSQNASEYHAMIPAEGGVFLFTRYGQQKLHSGDSQGLSPSTAVIDPISAYLASPDKCHPIFTDNSVYFSVDRGDYAQVWQLLYDPRTASATGVSRSEHVPEYIPSSIRKLAASSTDNIMVALTQDNRSLWAYTWRDGGEGGGRILSSWSKWTLPGTVAKILDASWIEGRLHLIVQRPDAVYIEVADFTSLTTDTGREQFIVHLDRRISNESATSVAYDATTNRTTVILPFFHDVRQGELVLYERVKPPTDFRERPLVQKIPFTTSNSSMTPTPFLVDRLTIVGDYSSQGFFAGVDYTSSFEPSQFFLREDKQSGSTAIKEGRLQMRRLRTGLDRTGRLLTKVTSRIRDGSPQGSVSRLTYRLPRSEEESAVTDGNPTLPPGGVVNPNDTGIPTSNSTDVDNVNPATYTPNIGAAINLRDVLNTSYEKLKLFDSPPTQESGVSVKWSTYDPASALIPGIPPTQTAVPVPATVVVNNPDQPILNTQYSMLYAGGPLADAKTPPGESVFHVALVPGWVKTGAGRFFNFTIKYVVYDFVPGTGFAANGEYFARLINNTNIYDSWKVLVYNAPLAGTTRRKIDVVTVADGLVVHSQVWDLPGYIPVPPYDPMAPSSTPANLSGTVTGLPLPLPADTVDTVVLSINGTDVAFSGPVTSASGFSWTIAGPIASGTKVLRSVRTTTVFGQPDVITPISSYVAPFDGQIPPDYNGILLVEVTGVYGSTHWLELGAISDVTYPLMRIEVGLGSLNGIINYERLDPLTGLWTPNTIVEGGGDAYINGQPIAAYVTPQGTFRVAVKMPPGSKAAFIKRKSDEVTSFESIIGLGILRSYNIPPPPETALNVYTPLKDRNFVYDQAVAVIAACNMNDINNAERWVNGLIFSQLKAVSVLNKPDGSTATVDGIGEFAFSINRYSSTAPDPYFRNGASAWCGTALIHFCKTFPTSRLASTALASANLLIEKMVQRYRVTDGTQYQHHLFRGGRGRYPADYLSFDETFVIPWVSCEHNLDITFMLHEAADLTGREDYRQLAIATGNALLNNLWIPSEGRFAQGASPGSLDLAQALDLNSWGALILLKLGHYQKALEALRWVEEFRSTNGVARGYTPYVSGLGAADAYEGAVQGVWSEGSWGVILANAAVGRYATARREAAQLYPLINANGYPYTTVADNKFELQTWESVAGTGWAILALNPRGHWYVQPNIAFGDELVDTPGAYVEISSANSPVFTGPDTRIFTYGAAPDGRLGVVWRNANGLELFFGYPTVSGNYVWSVFTRPNTSSGTPWTETYLAGTLPAGTTRLTEGTAVTVLTDGTTSLGVIPGVSINTPTGIPNIPPTVIGSQTSAPPIISGPSPGFYRYNWVGANDAATGVMNVPLGGRSEDVRVAFESVGPHPFTVTSMEWTADFTAQTKRI